MIKKDMKCNCGCMHHHGMGAICLGSAILIGVAMRYMNYGYREIAAVFGVLLILKGIFKMTKCKC
ncbi:MAG: hypothetical protein PHU12_00575 [Candidatus Aenigmarchaeota archaeon]|nr:hypothetical protein [Candidatus Aenigmarchaeota archaeon]